MQCSSLLCIAEILQSIVWCVNWQSHQNFNHFVSGHWYCCFLNLLIFRTDNSVVLIFDYNLQWYIMHSPLGILSPISLTVKSICFICIIAPWISTTDHWCWSWYHFESTSMLLLVITPIAGIFSPIVTFFFCAIKSSFLITIPCNTDVRRMHYAFTSWSTFDHMLNC